MKVSNFRQWLMAYWSGYKWFVWFMGAAFFLLEYTVRVSPAVMRKSLMHDFELTNGQFGYLSAMFQVTYLMMQLPVGILTDRYGASRLLSLSILIFSLSCYGFSASEVLWQAQLCRFLMGFSGSFAFVCTLKLAMLWFKPSKMGLLSGMTQIMGMLGSAGGSLFLPSLLQAYGWRMVILGFAAMLAVLFLLVFVLISEHHERPVVQDDKVFEPSWYDGLFYVISNKQTWVNASIAGLIYLPTAVLGELWGPMYFEQMYGLSELEASRTIGWIFIGWGIGGSLNGWLSDYLSQRRPTLIYSAWLSLFWLMILLFSPAHGVYSLAFCCLAYGFCNTGVVTAYAVASELNPKCHAGTSIAFTNMLSILYGVIYMPVLGDVLDFFWDGTMVSGEPVYSNASLYGVMLLLPLGLLLAGYLAGFCLKETHCMSYEKRVN